MHLKCVCRLTKTDFPMNNTFLLCLVARMPGFVFAL